MPYFDTPSSIRTSALGRPIRPLNYPAGTFFGGATSRMGSSFGGKQRQMWMDAEQEPEQAGGDFGGFFSGAGTPMNDNSSAALFARHQMLTRRGLLPGTEMDPEYAATPAGRHDAAIAARRGPYLAAGAMEDAARQFGVTRNAMAKNFARRQRMGNLGELEQLRMQQPGFAGQEMQIGLQREALGQAGRQFGVTSGLAERKQQFDEISNLVGAIPEWIKSGALSPEQGGAMYRWAMQKFGAPGGAEPFAPSGKGAKAAGPAFTAEERRKIEENKKAGKHEDIAADVERKYGRTAEGLRKLREATGNRLATFGKPRGPGFFERVEQTPGIGDWLAAPAQALFGEAGLFPLGNSFWGLPEPNRARGVRYGQPGEKIRLAHPITLEHLTDQPGDTPAQRHARESLRKRYPAGAQQVLHPDWFQP